MKILFVSRFFPYIGGRETMVKHLADKMSETHDVALLTPDMGRPSLGYKTIKYPENNTEQMLSVLQKFNPDVINSHTFYLTEPVLEAAQKLDIPVALTLHGDLLNCGSDEDVKNFKRTVRSVQKLITVCKHGYKTIHEAKIIDDDRLALIQNGINLQMFKPRLMDRTAMRTMFGIPENKFVYITPVRMTPLKGVEFLIETIGSMDVHSDMHFLITTPPARHRDGEVEYTEKIFQLICKYNLKDTVSLLFFDYSSMPLIYNLSDAFILPSKTEQLPITIMEAQASQLPAIATNVGGISELIENEKTGLLIEYDDKNSLGKAIRKVYFNTSAREHIGKSARDHILESYSFHTMTDHYLKLFKEIAG